MELSNSLYKLVYVERESPFGIYSCIDLENGEKVTRLWNLQRIIGTITGLIKEYNPKEKQGKIEVEGCTFSFEDVSKEGLTDYVGKESLFTFWPTSEEISDFSSVSRLKISQVRKENTPPSGYIEAIGKLEQISSGGFVVSVWSMAVKKLFYLAFSGDYPKEHHVGRVVWVVGQFEPKHMKIYLKETKSVRFLPMKDAISIVENQKKIRSDKTQQKKLAQKPIVKAVSPEDMWKIIMTEEVERMTVNAKLKIVLKELPATIKDMGNMVWIPLQNQAKGVSGSVELPDMPLELLVSKKMWSKTKTKADSVQEESGVPPVYVVEGLIGLKEGKLVTVASGIQVMSGKKKEEA